MAGLTYATADRKVERGAAEEAPVLTYKPRWRRADALLSILLAGLVALVWLYFSPLFF